MGPDLGVLSTGLLPAGQSGPGAGNPLAALITTLQQLVQGQSAMAKSLTDQIAASFPTFVSVPANSAAPGVAGQMSYDAAFFYICTGAGAWRRVAIAAF